DRALHGAQLAARPARGHHHAGGGAGRAPRRLTSPPLSSPPLSSPPLSSRWWAARGGRPWSSRVDVVRVPAAHAGGRVPGEERGGRGYEPPRLAVRALPDV